MAKQIVVLETTAKNRLRVAFWLSVPVARQPFYADSNKKSRYKDATAGELSAITSGAVAEQVGEFTVDGLTITQVRALLSAEFTKRQNDINTYNPWSRYGTSWDGTTWTSGGVP